VVRRHLLHHPRQHQEHLLRMSRFSASPIVAAFARHDAAAPGAVEVDPPLEVVNNAAEDDANVALPQSDGSRRSLQQVVTIANCKETIKWMVREFNANGKKELLSKRWLTFLNSSVEATKPIIRRYPLGGGIESSTSTMVW
jgi:hypothetical protein